ncbi:hypothetical protein ACMD2_25368 [Ananas comosus]|uniref:Uncharacterized protein n=1 Tax=Ananas comosus TaxID=4615 RepID=A0A199V9C5_ANACO|nr:hypothetical protein ACMD2_25368 [Ananas comosus]
MKKRVSHAKFTTNMISESSKQQGQQNNGLLSQETSKYSSKYRMQVNANYHVHSSYQRSNFQTAADQLPPLSRNENVDEADYGLLSRRMQYSTRSGTVRSRMKAGPLPNIVEHAVHDKPSTCHQDQDIMNQGTVSANRGGKELSRAEIFVLTHTKKNKEPMNKASSDHIKRIHELQSKLSEDNEDNLAQKISFPTDKKVDMLNEKIHNMEEKYRKMMEIFGSEENYEKVMAMFTSMQQTKTSEPPPNDAPIAQSDHLKDRQNYENECSPEENSQQEIESSSSSHLVPPRQVLKVNRRTIKNVTSTQERAEVILKSPLGLIIVLHKELL